MKRLLADSVSDVFGTINPPAQVSGLGTGKEGINNLLDNIIGLFFSAGAIAFILLFVWGAVQMILSGGDKEAISKARAKITWAIIGVALLSLSYFIFLLLQRITGFSFFATG